MAFPVKRVVQVAAIAALAVGLYLLGRYGEDAGHAPPSPSGTDATAQAQREFDEGIRLYEEGKYEQAIEKWRLSLALAERGPTREESKADCHVNIGMALEELRRNDEAISEWEKALVIYRMLPGTGEKQATCSKLMEMTQAATRQDQARGARPRAPAETQQLNESRKQYEEGQRLSKAGDMKRAVECFQKALALAERVPDTEAERINCHLMIGAGMHALGRSEDAVAASRKVLALCEGRAATDLKQADAHKIGGLALKALSRFQEAIEEQRKAYALYSQFAATEQDRADCLLEIADLQLELGPPVEAIAELNRTLGLLAKLPGTDLEQAACHGDLGIAMCYLGSFEQAIVEQRKALAICARLPGTEEVQGNCHLTIGTALYGLGRPEEAIEEQRRAMAIYAKLPDAESLQTRCRVNIGLFLEALGRHEEAIEEERAALAVYSKPPGNESGQADCHANIGTALNALGRYQESLQEQQLALTLYRRVPGTWIQQDKCRLRSATPLIALGRFADAAAELEAGRHAGIGAWWYHDARAQAAEGLGGEANFNEALNERFTAIMMVELKQMLFTLASENRMSWFEERASVYELMASLLLHMGREKAQVTVKNVLEQGGTVEEMALHFADRGKGRTLLELVGNRVLETGDPASSALLAERSRLDGEINALAKRRGPAALPGKEKEFDELTKQIEQKQARQREIEAELRRTGAGAFFQPELLKPAEFCKTLRPGEGCLEYVACEKELLVFLATAGGVKAFRQEILRDAPIGLRERGRLSMEKLVEAYRKTPDKPEALGLEGLVRLQREWMDEWRKRSLTEAEHVAVSYALGRVLLPADLRKALDAGQVKHLVIVPARVSALTSFATLVIGARQGDAAPKALAESRFLIEDYSLSYVQSLSLLNPIRKRIEEKRRTEPVPTRRELIAIADPVHDDADPRAAQKQLPVQLAEAETSRTGADTLVRGLVRNVGIAPDAGLALRWPRLAETRKEAEAAAAEFGAFKVHEDAILSPGADGSAASICVGYAANRPLATSPELGKYRHILFGVHGYSDMANPWLSSLMLTDLAARPGTRQPAPLTMADVFRMKLSADTVVLAACQTAMGRMRAGEGVVGFQLAFLSAGADSVVLTQWEVPSVVDAEGGRVYPATEVITGFYRDLRRGDVLRPEALRRAQLNVLKRGGRFVDPFYWGAWQLYGEWR
jgi:tetratricopeptide (TPR) repeat protein/CHAT domain-containing protein